MAVRADTARNGAAPTGDAGDNDVETFRSGRFDLHFGDERAARAAARDARAVGFVVDVRADEVGGWVIGSRRKDAFPADDGDRYASRLRVIAAAHGGVYDRFVGE